MHYIVVSAIPLTMVSFMYGEQYIKKIALRDLNAKTAEVLCEVFWFVNILWHTTFAMFITKGFQFFNG